MWPVSCILVFPSSPEEPVKRTSAIRFLRTELPLVIVLIGAAYVQLPAQAPSTGLATPNPQDVIAYLNQSIDWYRHLVNEEGIASDPSDVLFVNDNRQTASQIVRLSFEFARAAAQLATTQAPPQANPSPANARFQNLIQIAAQTDQVVRQTQTEIDQVRNQAQTARATDRQKLQATVEELQSELALAQARSEAVHNIIQFASTGSGGASGGNLLAQVQELQRSVPEVTLSNPVTPADGQAKSGTTSTGGASAASTNTRHEQPTGLLALITDLLSLTRKIHVIDDTLRSTDALADTSQSLRTPLSKNISPLVQRGNVLAQQADTSDVAGLQQQKRELDALTAQFKQNSSMVLPLSKQAVLLDLFKSNLSRWRDAVKTQYQFDLKNLGVRLVVLTLVVGTFFVLGEVWKRATFRYVHDFRRRYQFLLLRRILLWFVIAVTIAFALATEIGSLATFAGLITAGIAVALQNVILAVAGYFFLIGRYGVKVGDRVQISGVTGDVIDIGLVRLHLMEMGGSGNYIQPTGRVVVFSNSIVFQPTASFYKQIPGTNFVWHEVSLTLAPQSDTAVAESRLLGAVEKIFATYKDRIEQEHKHMQSLLNVRGAIPKPTSRLRLTQTGLEVIIRYPVELDNAAEIDDRITRELLAALEREPRLRLVGSGTPNIQPVPVTNAVETDGASSATDVKK
jgi:small-conductance mechanosensitive channel